MFHFKSASIKKSRSKSGLFYYSLYKVTSPLMTFEKSPRNLSHYLMVISKTKDLTQEIIFSILLLIR